MSIQASSTPPEAPSVVFNNENGDIIYAEYPDGAQDRLGKVTQREESGTITFSWTAVSDGEELDMLRFSPETGILTIFPKSVSSDQLKPAFQQVTRIELELERPLRFNSDHFQLNDRFGLIEVNGLPEGFSGVFAYGIGLKRDFRGLIHWVEEHTSCDTVRFSKDGAEGTSEDNRVFTTTFNRFKAFRNAIRTGKSRGYTAVARVRTADTHNVLASTLGLDNVEVKFGKHPTINALTEEVRDGFVTTRVDLESLARHTFKEASKIAAETPPTFYKLRSELELVSLATLINRFNEDLRGPDRNNEKHWQAFFELNPFALQQIFAMPIAIFQREAVVKSANVAGSGSRVADFLCANTITRTAMVVEIKTPNAGLMAKNPYRGTGGAEVFAANADLAGSIAQLQAQMESVRADLPARLGLKDDLEVIGDVRGALIIGTLGALSSEQKKSFLRFRDGFANLTILTYDEVVARLEALLAVLSADSHLG